jgi:hypothetical protein
MTAVQLEQFVSVEEAAEIIGCTGAHVRHLLCLEKPLLKGRKPYGSFWLVERKSAEAYASKPQTRGRPRVSA